MPDALSFSTIRAMNADVNASSLPAALAELCLHVDNDCIVMIKPSGLHSVPGIGPDKADSLLSRLRAWDDNIYAVHRLDRDTSGVMVFGRHPAAISNLGKQFQARSVEKSYRARVYGEPLHDNGQIELKMRYDPDNKPRQAIDSISGKPSLTHWSVISRHNNWSLLELIPITGRTHQLRLHMSSINHPILGDSLYAHDDAKNMSPRLCLHAYCLSFNHPSSNERLTFSHPENFNQP
ncbi:MAG: RluA family pseudouridine synthase [Moraxellaceae bacterium]|nr:RluA family pseudouridine synthase [Moraxellaceae bacterium]